MTSFIDLKYSARHQGADRFGSAVEAAQQVRDGFLGTRGLATLLLSAFAAGLMVLADQIMDSVAEGHLLAMWAVLWVVAFAALALFAGAMRQIAARLKSSLDGWSRSVAQARADRRLWAAAKADPRVMAELQAAMMRNEVQSETQGAAPAQDANWGSSMLRSYQHNCF